MATVTSLTEEKIQELVAGWEGVSLTQDQLNSLVQQLWNNNESQDANLSELRDVILPALQADLDAGSIRVSDLNDNHIPALEARLDQHDLNLTNLNTVDIPNLNAQLTSNSNWILEFDEVTVPALQTQLDTNTGAITTLNDTTLPQLSDRLTAVESTAGGSDFDATALWAQIDANTGSLDNLNTVVLPALDTRLVTLENEPPFDDTALQSQLDTLAGKFPVHGDDIAADTITANQIAADAVTANEIAANTITAMEIAADTITANEIAADSITASEIASRTITALEILTDTITANEIAVDTITANEIAGRTITAAEIAADAITANEIAADTITAAEIATRTITALEILGDTITANEIAADTITANEIAADTITASEIAADSVTANEIAGRTITALEIAADAITANEIATDSITANEIAADTITANEIATDAITATEIAGRTITAAEIEVDTITANEIAADTITANEIAADAITANEIAADAITAVELAATAIDGMTITGVEVFGGRFVSDNPLASGVQVIVEETPDDAEFSKSGRMRFVTGEAGVTDGIVIGSVIDYAGDSKGRRLFIRPPYAQVPGVGPLEAPTLSLEAMSGDANPAVAGVSWGRAGMFAPVLGFSARPNSVGSGTEFDGGLILQTHAGAGGDPESRVRLGNREVTLGVKDASGVLQKGRVRVDQLQTRFDAPNAAGVVDERVRLDADESLIYSPNKQHYVWVKDTGVSSSAPISVTGGSPYSRRTRTTDTGNFDNLVWTRLNCNVNDETRLLGYASGTYTIQVAGRYNLSACAQFSVAANIAHRLALMVVKNGFNMGRKDTFVPAAGQQVAYAYISMSLHLEVGDTVEFQGWQNSGGPLVVNGSTTDVLTWATISYEGPV